MLSRADDVTAALTDWQTFSSATGTLIDTDISLIPPNMFNMDRPVTTNYADARAGLTPRLLPASNRKVRAFTEGSSRNFSSTGISMLPWTSHK